jgi:3-phenylpropionate/cinnamic acid dioxygenase small subunit
MPATADHDLITDVLVRYATGIDTRDWALFRTCFTEDVHADYGADVGTWNDAGAMTEYMTVMHQDIVDSKHMLSNFVIEVEGDTATASTYVHAVLVAVQDPLTWFDVVGCYEDRLVRTPDGWRIGHRAFHPTRTLSSHTLTG